MDYTPGIFQIRLDYWQEGKKPRVHTTLAKQLALYVTLYSPLQMAADLPEAYERFLDAFQFIKDVPVDWDTTIVVDAEPGDYVAMARKERDGNDWFVGAITDQHPRDFSLDLSFLKEDGRYEATVYSDAPDAHWDTNPMAYGISTVQVTKGSVLKLSLAEGGGAAVRLALLK
jgi:hypothetical protein